MKHATSVRSVNHWSLSGADLRQSSPGGKSASCSILPTTVTLFLSGEFVAKVFQVGISKLGEWGVEGVGGWGGSASFRDRETVHSTGTVIK